MALSKTWNNTAYSIPQSGERGWASLTNFLSALADGAQSTGKQFVGRRVATVSPVTVTATTDCYVGVNVASAIAAVNLPAGVNGQVFIIADESDAANTYNITINPNGANTINSTTSLVLNQNSQCVFLLFSGTDWVVIHSGSPTAPITAVTDSSKIDFTLTAGNLTATIVAGSLVNADVNASAAIAYSKLNLATSIVNADVAVAAAIARTKIANGSVAHVVINDGSGTLSSEAQLATTRGGTGISNAGTLTYGSNNITLTTSGSTGVTLPTTGTLATLAGTEALTNKDYQGGTASNTSRITIPKSDTATLAALTRKQGTVVYDTSLNKLKYDDGSNLNLVGSGSGGGGSINYISNGDFEDGTITGWATYSGGTTTPTNGTGGSPSSTFAISSSSPLRGTYNGLWTKSAANRQGEGFSYAFTLATADLGKTLQVTFDCLASANMVSGDMTVYVYDVTNSVLITPSSINLPTGTSSQYSLAFQATTGTSYRLIFHTSTTSALAYTVQVDQMSISPIVRPTVAGESDWIAYTPTYSAGFGTVTNVAGFWKRVGDTMHVMTSGTAGTVTGAAGTITLPGSFTILSSKLPVPAGANLVGFLAAQDGTATGQLTPIAAQPTSSTTQVYLTSKVSGANLLANAGVSTSITNSNAFSVQFQVPITQWSSNITLASTTPMIEYVYNTSTTDAADTTSFGYGAAGIAGILNTTALTALRQKRVRFQNPIQPTDRLQLEVSSNRTTWSPVQTYDNTSLITALTYQNAVTYGMALTLIASNTTDVDVYFGQYSINNGATFGAVGRAWTSTGVYYWRVAKYSAIGGAELAPATATSAGTVSGGTVPGKTDGTAIATGYIGDVITSSVSASNAASTGTYGDLTSLSLTPGCWDISIYGTLANNGATISGANLVGISTTSGNSSTGLTLGTTRIDIFQATSSTNCSFCLNAVRANLSATTTYYFKQLSTFSVATPQYYATIRAVRVG